ncbi:MAG: hypothetical protein H6Q90_5673 [Deltaproteobacteria bacterium]|nr:hypothetical protein [Deltaproteobacteria bacterium]
MRLAYVILLVFVSTPVFAEHEPVRDDVVDLRHNRLPNRRVFLGWTADGRAVAHVVTCGVNDGGGPFCVSNLEVTGRDKGAGKSESTLVLQPACPDPCAPHGEKFIWTVPTELASQAIRTERAALDRLGALLPSVPNLLPNIEAIGSTCRVDLMVGKRRVPRVAMLSPKECITDGGSESFHGARVGAVQMSPDRLTLAVTITIWLKFMEWSDAVDVTKLVDAN